MKYIIIISKDPTGEQDKAADKLRIRCNTFIMQRAEPLLTALFPARTARWKINKIRKYKIR